MERMVVGFAGGFCKDKQVLLIRKNRPDWARGLLNGIGGHIEEGETPHEAMVREFEQEAGVKTKDWKKYCEIINKGNWIVHYFVTRMNLAGCQTVTDEPVNTYHRDKLPINVITDLYWLIPMAFRDTRTYCIEINTFGRE